MLKNGKDKTISIRLEQTMLEALDSRAVLDEKDRTQVIREAIAHYLGLPLDPVEERLAVIEDRVEELSRLVAMCVGKLK
jgi:metal-responsive CopG/Arc/MetJ family transcriptional regulator